MFSTEEKDRLIEILIYLYFNNKDAKILAKEDFWHAIKNICNIYKIDSLSISKSVRILMASENVPNDEETYYLLKKLGLSVRQINRVSGIYWQKQKAFDEKFTKEIPYIKRRIVDIVVKKNIRDFIFALYEVLGIFGSVDIKLLEDTL